MQALRGDHSTASWLVQHPLSAEDRAAMTAMRATVESNKGKLQGIAARVPFDAIMEHVSAPAGVHYEADLVGGIPGWWCRPETARAGQAVMHIHGGWFNWGSAQAFRHLAGHIAVSAGVAERAVATGVDARLDVWEGMAHGHLGGIGRLAASAETLQLIGEFLTDRFAKAEDGG